MALLSSLPYHPLVTRGAPVTRGRFVKHAFERCQANAFGFKPLKGGRSKKYDGKLSMDETTHLFNKKVAPSLRPPFLPYHPLVTRGVPHDTCQVAPSLRPPLPSLPPFGDTWRSP